MITLLYVFVALLGFSLVVFIHELGHFLAAKKVGVRVEVFSVGMGPRIWGIKRGDTDYRLALFPFGGYVKMVGQDDSPGETKLEGHPWEYPSKTVGERLQIILAGVIFNFVSSFGFLFLAALVGIKVIAPEVGEVLPGSPADKAEIKPGSRITKVGDRSIRTYSGFMEAIVLSGADEPVTLTLEKNGKPYEATVTPQKVLGQPFAQIGIGQPVGTTVNPRKLGIAEKAGLKEQDTIVAVNGTPVANWMEVEAILAQHIGTSVDLSVEREGQSAPVTVAIVPEAPQKPTLGFDPGAPTLITSVESSSPAYQAGLRSGDVVLSIAGQSVSTFKAMSKTIKAQEGKPMNVTFLRDGEQQTLTITPAFDKVNQRHVIGIQYDESNLYMLWKRIVSANPVFDTLLVHEVLPGSKAEAAGLKAGDRITTVDGNKVVGPETFYKSVTPKLLEVGRFGKTSTLNMSVLRDGKTLEMAVDIDRRPIPAEDLADSGAPLAVIDVDNGVKREHMQLDFGGAVSYAVHEPFSLLLKTYQTLYRLVQAKISLKNLGGPVTIARATYYQTQNGLGNLLWFLALISVNLAVMNLLPIPILDGGHVVLLIIEKLKGGPLGMKTQVRFQYVGAAFLFSLMGFVMFNDILRWVGINL